MSVLSKEELSPELYLDGIIATKVPRLCKGGNDPFNTGFGWLVFLRADAKDPSLADGAWLSSANKKFMQYNDDVLVPFIHKLREDLGWTPGEPVPEWMTALSWFDGGETLVGKGSNNLVRHVFCWNPTR